MLRLCVEIINYILAHTITFIVSWRQRVCASHLRFHWTKYDLNRIHLSYSMFVGQKFWCTHTNSPHLWGDICEISFLFFLFCLKIFCFQLDKLGSPLFVFCVCVFSPAEEQVLVKIFVFWIGGRTKVRLRRWRGIRELVRAVFAT